MNTLASPTVALVLIPFHFCHVCVEIVTSVRIFIEVAVSPKKSTVFGQFLSLYGNFFATSIVCAQIHCSESTHSIRAHMDSCICVNVISILPLVNYCVCLSTLSSSLLFHVASLNSKQVQNRLCRGTLAAGRNKRNEFFFFQYCSSAQSPFEL